MSYSKKIDNAKDRLARAYALWRIKPTEEESHAYNHTDRILLTFDDYLYGDSVSMYHLLDILRDQKVKAAFFLVGKWAQENLKIVNAIKADGHWIGNHTFSHQRLTKLSSAEIEKEIKDGVPSKLLRPPYGAYNNRVRKIAAKLGYRIAFWTIDSDDWKGMDASRIQERVLGELHPGACILLHLHAPQTIKALPSLIQGIRARGFELCNNGTEISL
jgi:peptidoglycan/xylan/chitin deacetylase (PgdA/CDA1 family)